VRPTVSERQSRVHARSFPYLASPRGTEHPIECLVSSDRPSKPSVSFGINPAYWYRRPMGLHAAATLSVRSQSASPRYTRRPLNEAHDSIQGLLGLWIIHGVDTSLAAHGATDSFSTRDKPVSGSITSYSLAKGGCCQIRVVRAEPQDSARSPLSRANHTFCPRCS
jgi:hypothetical protein